MAKTASFGVMHLATAFGVGYALTGDIAIAGAITFVEPAVNTVMHYFHDKHWDRIAGMFKREERTGHLGDRVGEPAGAGS